jgi:hypothetical protein
MKNQFDFYGVRSPQRKDVFKWVWNKQEILITDEYIGQILCIINHPKRELNYYAIDLAICCQKKIVIFLIFNGLKTSLQLNLGGIL